MRTIDLIPIIDYPGKDNDCPCIDTYLEGVFYAIDMYQVGVIKELVGYYCSMLDTEELRNRIKHEVLEALSKGIIFSIDKWEVEVSGVDVSKDGYSYHSVSIYVNPVFANERYNELYKVYKEHNTKYPKFWTIEPLL